MMRDESMSKQEARRYLAAFADGELDVEQNLRVLEQMAMDPANTRRVLHQQQLRRAVRQSMARPEHACPEDLHARIAELSRTEPAGAQAVEPNQSNAAWEPMEAVQGPNADQPPSTHDDGSAIDLDQPASAKSPVLARIGQWAPTVAAACLLIVALISLYSVRGGINTSSMATASAEVTQAQYGEFRKRHQVCTADVAKLFDTVTFPREIKQLPGAIEDYFTTGSGPVPGHLIHSLDLSVLGYHFVRAGACVVPGAGAVHIVYRRRASNDGQTVSTASEAGPPGKTRAIHQTSNTAASDRRQPKAMSLWVKLDEGNFQIKPGKVYKAGGEADQPPLLIWKWKGRMYYLIGDVPADVHEAARMMCRH